MLGDEELARQQSPHEHERTLFVRCSGKRTRTHLIGCSLFAASFARTRGQVLVRIVPG